MGDFDYSIRTHKPNNPYFSYACQDVTVSGETIDYSIKENTTLFSVLTSPREVLIRNGSENIALRLNSVSHDEIPLSANAVFGPSPLILTDIYITVSGSADATLNIFTQGWK